MTFPFSPATPLILASLLSCPAIEPAAVTLDFTTAPPGVVSGLSSRQLADFDVKTTFSHHRNEIFTTGGITKSNLSASFNLNFKKLSEENSKQTCLWLETVTLKISYTPQVYIASEYPPGSCRYKTTYDHEIQHVNIDLITLKESLPGLKAAVEQAAYRKGAIGPMIPELTGQKQDELGDKIRTAMDTEMDKIDRLRTKRQQTIDTRQEYMRLSKACPKEPTAGTAPAP